MSRWDYFRQFPSCVSQIAVTTLEKKQLNMLTWSLCFDSIYGEVKTATCSFVLNLIPGQWASKLNACNHGGLTCVDTETMVKQGKEPSCPLATLTNGRGGPALSSPGHTPRERAFDGRGDKVSISGGHVSPTSLLRPILLAASLWMHVLM